MRNLVRVFIENRLKVASVIAVLGDTMMALAGGANIFYHARWTSLSDFCLLMSGISFYFAHTCMLLWSKGGRLATLQKTSHKKETNIFLRPFKPQSYPLDCASVFFAFGGFLILASGFLTQSINVVLSGGCIMVASLTVWLWPENKTLFGLPVLRATAFLYAFSSINALIGGYRLESGFMFAAGCLWLICNIIYATVRKENQSAFTQSAEFHNKP